MSDKDIQTLTQLLLDDPETYERLHIDSLAMVSDGGFEITVRNAEGDRHWKHRIFTEEV